MLLQRLIEHGQALGDSGPPMYQAAAVRYEIELSRAGDLLGIITLTGDASRRNDRGKTMWAPTLVRAYAIKPILLADHAEYTLGIGREKSQPGRVSASHAAYVDLVRACAEATNEPDVAAVVSFYAQTDLTALALPDDFDLTARITFSIEGRRPIDLPSVQRFWLAHAGTQEGDGTEGLAQCLVCGERRPPVERLQFKIRGIPGAAGPGAALISANEQAFLSYGLRASQVSPICQECVEGFSKTLNTLLSQPDTRLWMPPLVYAFWSRGTVPWSLATLLSQPDPQAVGELLRAAHSGRVGALELDAAQLYAVGLSASNGRVVVRDWLDTTIGEAQQRLARYFRLQRIAGADGGEPRPYSLRELVLATQRDGDTGEPPPNVPRALLRLALAGGPLPGWLLARVIGRLRAGNRVSPQRAALVKMVLLSGQSTEEEHTMAELDTAQRHPAYLCGRLFAVLDQIQRLAISPNATIVDRFFGTASSAPATVFGRLVRGAQPHLGKLRRTRRGAVMALEARLAEIIGGIEGGFPRTLTLEEQGQFVLGFYHERAASIAAARARRAARGASAPDMTEPIDDAAALAEAFDEDEPTA